MQSDVSGETAQVYGTDAAYEQFISVFNTQALSLVHATGQKVFITDAQPKTLWDAYLGGFPESERQWHNCAACRRFIKKFGRLVVISDDGHTASPFWSQSAPAEYAASFAAMNKVVAKAKVVGVFLHENTVWGIPVNHDEKHNCDWHHLSFRPPKDMVFFSMSETANQRMAKLVQNRKQVRRAMGEYPLEIVQQAAKLLAADSLWSGEKVAGPLNWFLARKISLEKAENKTQAENLLWKAIASAPDGFCAPRSSLTGTLLDDLQKGLPLDQVKKNFAAKVKPENYQRPKAAPAEGTIKQAEELVAKLGIAPSLNRRFAVLDDLLALGGKGLLWRPPVPHVDAGTGSVFGHLSKTKAGTSDLVDTQAQQLSLQSLLQRLQDATRVELFTPRNTVGQYAAMLTAADLYAPPILRWDHADKRWPFSSYVYHGNGGGRTPEAWNLKSTWSEVVAVVDALPPDVIPENETPRLLFVLKDCRDLSSGTGTGNALFPANLKPALHSVRSVIEAYSQKATTGGADQPNQLCGLIAVNKGAMDLKFRVTTPGLVKSYHVVLGS